MSHVTDRQAVPPPRPAKPLTLPLDQLWSQGLGPNIRQQVLRKLTQIAGRTMTPPFSQKEVNDE